MTTTTKAPKLFPIPAGEREASCRSCGAPIYWALQPSGARMPIEVRDDVEGALHPSTSHGGFGTSHFASCPNADLHRRRR